MNQQAPEADLFSQQPPDSRDRETKSSDATLFSKHGENQPGGRRKPPEQKGLSANKRQAEEYLSPFFELSLDLFCIAGLDGYFKHLNAAWTTCLGWTLDELTARPFEDFVHPDDRGATRSEIGRLSEGEETILFENRYRHKDGSYRLLQWNALPISELGQIYATARDITAQRRLEREVLEILDQEKERLGCELHDGLCQTMAGIAALSATLSKKLSATGDLAASAAEITKLLSECIGEARGLARGLSPMELKEAGVEEALEALALNVEHLHRISCTFECDRPVPALGPEIEAHLFRIAQEAVNNALTHGRAERIEISLTSKSGEVLLSIRDDGVGLPNVTLNPEGIGMHTMAYRARVIRASFTVRRRLRGGTAVICTFPLSDPTGSGRNRSGFGSEAVKEVSK